MATVTAVITYSGTLASGDCEVTSYTWAGSAFTALTVAETKQARQALTQALNITGKGGSAASPVGDYTGHAASGRGT